MRTKEEIMLEPTLDVLVSDLHIKQINFEIFNNNLKESTTEFLQEIIKYVPAVEIRRGVYYRGRIIELCDGKDKGVLWENNIPVTGYDIDNSGVAPENCIVKRGRINQVNEQVLYIAENEQTAVYEVTKENKQNYISLASCLIEHSINVVDFSAINEELFKEVFPKEMRTKFSEQFGMSWVKIYVQMQMYLSSEEYAENDYLIPLKLIELIKKNKALSGIKYASSYTMKSNIALWDENVFLKCDNSIVTHHTEWI